MRAASARFGVVRARFNKRSTQVSPKGDHRLNFRDVPFRPLRLPESGRFALRRTIIEDDFALDGCSGLLRGPGICRAGAIRL